MDITASYLNESEGDGRNPTHFVPELSRRARGFAVWAVIQVLGRQGVCEIVSRHCACAARLSKILADEPGIKILNDVCLNQIAFTVSSDMPAEDSEAITNEFLSEIGSDHGPFLRSAKWKGHTIVRVSVISPDTTMQHIEELARRILSAYRSVAYCTVRRISKQGPPSVPMRGLRLPT